MTGLIALAAVLVIAAIVAVAMKLRRQRQKHGTRLERLLALHRLAEAMGRAEERDDENDPGGPA